MTVAFFTNYLNSHWLDFCDELYRELGSNFSFFSRILSSEKTNSRGAKACVNRPYVKEIIETNIPEDVLQAVETVDVVIVGSNNEDIYNLRKKTNKLVIRVSERSIKNKKLILKNLLRKIKYFLITGKQNNEVLLSLSSFCKNDFRFTRAYKNRIYKFGYFPTFTINDISYESKNDLSFLWVGRFVKWKHPEKAIKVIKKLISIGLEPTLTMVGSGNCYEKIEKQIKKQNLTKYVKLLGSKSQDDTRKIMQNNKYFLFTSDSNEGWGAVLNEAMNEKCITFASKFAGSTDYLIKDGINGFRTNNKINDIVRKLLVSRQSDEKQISENAYLTIKNEWNGTNAAKKFTEFINNFLLNNKLSGFKDGVLERDTFKKRLP